MVSSASEREKAYWARQLTTSFSCTQASSSTRSAPLSTWRRTQRSSWPMRTTIPMWRRMACLLSLQPRPQRARRRMGVMARRWRVWLRSKAGGGSSSSRGQG